MAYSKCKSILESAVPCPTDFYAICTLNLKLGEQERTKVPSVRELKKATLTIDRVRKNTP